MSLEAPPHPTHLGWGREKTLQIIADHQHAAHRPTNQRRIGDPTQRVEIQLDPPLKLALSSAEPRFDPDIFFATDGHAHRFVRGHQPIID